MPAALASHAALPPSDARLRRILDRAAAEIRASWTELERAATYVETARRLLGRGPVRVDPRGEAHQPDGPSRLARSHAPAAQDGGAESAPSVQRRARRPPATGARLPCTRTGCRGTMQFGREVVRHGQTMILSAFRAWVCSERAQHVHLKRRRHTNQSTVGLTARGRWEDDGGRRK
jgi:hypothetical protein